MCRELSKPLLRASSPLSTLAGAGAEERRSLPLKLWTFIHIQALCAFCFGVLYCFTVVQRFIIVQGDASSGPCFMLCCASHCFASLMATHRSLQGNASCSARPGFMLQGVASCSYVRFKTLLRAHQGRASCFVLFKTLLRALQDVASCFALNMLQASSHHH